MTRTIKKREPYRSRKKVQEPSGYVDCACRDCFEVAIGKHGDMCWECEAAGCEPHSECKAERDGE